MAEPIRTLADHLRAGSTRSGVIVKMPCPGLVELAGHAGFQVVVIDAEHGVGDTTELEHHIRAADAVWVDTLVRVGANTSLDILRALDAGAAGVIVPHVDTAADAELAVRSAHYPPKGRRGLALSTRAGRHGTRDLAEHLAAAAAHTVVIVQIEDPLGVKNVSEIASVHGVDALWCGPTDLSLAMGHADNPDHPEVRAAIDEVVLACDGEDRPALCALADGPDSGAQWVRAGAAVVLYPANGLIVGPFTAASHATTQ